MNKKLVVAIPLYRDFLDDFEKTSLERVFEVLGDKYSIIAFVPQDVEFNSIILQFPKLEVRRMPSENFKSWETYSHMMMKPEIYQLFSDFEYMLIYQTDCYIFEDHLDEFIDLDYDYIGSPWIPKYKYSATILKPWWTFRNGVFKMLHKSKVRHRINFKVGNGGFSLRKVKSFIEATTKYAHKAEHWNKTIKYYAEDVFFCIALDDVLRIAPLKVGLRFSFDTRPNVAYKMNKKKLPTGAHAWQREGVIDFWSPFINKKSR